MTLDGALDLPHFTGSQNSLQNFVQLIFSEILFFFISLIH